ncbi:MAG: pilus assembly protein PilM [Candidatus Omnitrophica bacterium]|nr:pilus assembly protein PilM [Candidatus Omnitrophota bacterium]
MSILGIYFGPQGITLVETEGKRILNNLQIPLESLGPGELEEKVPDEIKLVALFKEELRKNKITAKEAYVALSGKDLVIRTFEMPLLPRNELNNAIKFEAKKYLPFKTEELFLAHEIIFDKLINKNLVLLVGIKKEIMNKYISIFRQLDLGFSSLEYSAFSMLRILKMAGAIDKGVVGFLNVDLKEDDETNFIVLEKGFSLFSRDIILSPQTSPEPQDQKTELNALLEKLKTEVRISLDYYKRKFPTRHIEKVFLISPEDYQQDLEIFLKEMGLVSHFIAVNKFIAKPIRFSSSLLKAYSAAVAKFVRIPLSINLAAIKIEPEKEAEVLPAVPLRFDLTRLLKGLRISSRIVILAVCICFGAWGWGIYRRLPLKKEIEKIRSLWPAATNISPNANFDELKAIADGYKEKIETIDDLVTKRLFLTSVLDIIPRVIPRGLWLERLSFRREKGKEMELNLEGMAYLADSNKEFEAVNNFLVKLKQEPIFVKNFKEIRLMSLDRTMFRETMVMFRETMVTRFKISCQTQAGGRKEYGF